MWGGEKTLFAYARGLFSLIASILAGGLPGAAGSPGTTAGGTLAALLDATAAVAAVAAAADLAGGLLELTRDNRLADAISELEARARATEGRLDGA